MESRVSTITKGLSTRRLDSIQNRIVAFALLATLIPSISTAWVFYTQNKRALSESISNQLRTSSAQAARELDLWVKERFHEGRVFASSYEVSENLARIPPGGSSPAARLEAVTRLTDYVTSVQERFPNYQELLVIDPDGEVVASSRSDASTVLLPPEATDQLRAGNPLLGDAYADSVVGDVVLPMGAPIFSTVDSRFLGAMAGKMGVQPIQELLETFAPGDGGRVFLATSAGIFIASSGTRAQGGWDAEALRPLAAQEGEPVGYTDPEGRAATGVLRALPRLGWVIVAEIPQAEAFAEVRRLRNVTLLIMLALLVGVGGIAYLLGRLIVRPLRTLTRGVATVAGGDLGVDLPVSGGGEVGYLTQVFNDMVKRLREGREELERLSITDGLTGLYNRRHLLHILETEAGRSERSGRPFAVLMIDVDHFKKFNDTYGHLAGDEVLIRLARIIRETIRDVDFAARYGGEEFIVMLTETNTAGAVEVAERMRARLAQERFGDPKKPQTVTLSIGAAEYPLHGEHFEAVIDAADGCLYRAKRGGRDRVMKPTAKAKKKSGHPSSPKP